MLKLRFASHSGTVPKASADKVFAKSLESLEQSGV